MAVQTTPKQGNGTPEGLIPLTLGSLLGAKMPNHPTRLHQRSAAQIEIVTHDIAVQHKALRAHLKSEIIDFVFWNGDADEIVEGKVTAYHLEEPFRFTVKRELAHHFAQAKVAETARLERQLGGQPQIDSSADPVMNAAGPHDTIEHSSDATAGGGMLPEPGAASDNDLAPGE